MLKIKDYYIQSIVSFIGHLNIYSIEAIYLTTKKLYEQELKNNETKERNNNRYHSKL